jgi:hypothetical protein
MMETVPCEVCDEEVHVDDISVIPIGRSVCYRCAETYKSAAIEVVAREVHTLAITERVFEDFLRLQEEGQQ